MKRLAIVLPFAVLAGCASTPPVDTAALDAAARKTAGGLLQSLGGELKTAMTAGGPAAAIGVCKEKAPQMAKAAAETSGFMVKRASPKNRNPKAVPDAWEAAALAQLEQRLAAGEKPETLDLSALVDSPEGKVYRYAKALPTLPLCLNCHGDPEKLSPEVKAKLAAEYPDDKAVGYSAGMLRGILSLKKKL